MSGLDLYLSQKTLALLLVYGALTGFGLGALWDALRLLRMVFGEPANQNGSRPPLLAILVFVEDLLFAVIVALSFILLCYYENDGQIRIPGALGLFGGFFVYHHTISRLFIPAAEGLIRLVKGFLMSLLLLLTAPLKRLWTVTAGRWLESRRERVTEQRIREMTDRAARGFELLEENGSSPRKPE